MGFGVTASYVLQVAKHLSIETYVVTRSQKNKKAARKLGAEWVGDYEDRLPCKLDAGIIFPPAGNLVEFALGQLDRGGKLILAPVTMTPIEIKDYNLIWMEREVKSLANITRRNATEFLEIASKTKMKTRMKVFPFNKLPDTMIALKRGEIKSNAVIKI